MHDCKRGELPLSNLWAQGSLHTEQEERGYVLEHRARLQTWDLGSEIVC